MSLIIVTTAQGCENVRAIRVLQAYRSGNVDINAKFCIPIYLEITPFLMMLDLVNVKLDTRV